MSGVLLPRRGFGEPGRLARRGLAGDRWFTALDGTVLAVGPEPRRLRVLGVHVDDVYVWIQLAASDDPDMSFVVRVGDHTTPGEVAAALRALPGEPEPLTIVEIGRPGAPRS